MNTVRHLHTNGEFLLWTRRRGGQIVHVLYDMDGQIVCDFSSELPGRRELQSVIKGWQSVRRQGDSNRREL